MKNIILMVLPLTRPGMLWYDLLQNAIAIPGWKEMKKAGLNTTMPDITSPGWEDGFRAIPVYEEFSRAFHLLQQTCAPALYLW